MVFHFNKAHLSDPTIPMWILKFKGETHYVNHVECNASWSTKETPDNPSTKGSLKIKNVDVTIDDDFNAVVVSTVRTATSKLACCEFESHQSHQYVL